MQQAGCSSEAWASAWEHRRQEVRHSGHVDLIPAWCMGVLHGMALQSRGRRRAKWSSRTRQGGQAQPSSSGAGRKVLVLRLRPLALALLLPRVLADCSWTQCDGGDNGCAAFAVPVDIFVNERQRADDGVAVKVDGAYSVASLPLTSCCQRSTSTSCGRAPDASGRTAGPWRWCKKSEQAAAFP